VRAELQGKSDALAGAEAEVGAARAEREAADAALAARRSAIAEAEAMVAAMEADNRFWRQQSARNRSLLDRGALANEEFQRDAAMAANAASKVEQARARLAQALSEVRAAEAMVRKADAMVDVAGRKRQQLASDILAAEAAVRAVEAMAEVAEARVEEARVGAAQARGSLATQTVTHDFADIAAQIDGVVTERLISPGQLVAPGQAILRVAQIDPIRLQASVAAVDLARIKVGHRFIARGQSGAGPPVVAAVSSIAPTLDPASRTGIVEAVAPNKDGRFAPGQALGVEIAVGRGGDALRVPVAAIHERAEAGKGILAEGVARYAWVAEGGPGRYTVNPVEVRIGVSDGVNVQILSGLDAGRKVVVAGGANLKRGDRVFVPEETGVSR
jgi:RND family efflux transporter MFP subunit